LCRCQRRNHHHGAGLAAEQLSLPVHRSVCFP